MIRHKESFNHVSLDSVPTPIKRHAEPSIDDRTFPFKQDFKRHAYLKTSEQKHLYDKFIEYLVDVKMDEDPNLVHIVRG